MRATADMETRSGWLIIIILSHSLVVTLGAAVNQGVSTTSPGNKGTRLDIQLRCFLDLFPGRKPPLLIPLLRSNKQSITTLDAELFMLSVLALSRNDGFPLHGYTLCRVPGINMFFTYCSDAIFFFLTVSYFLTFLLCFLWPLERQQIQYNVHFSTAKEAMSMTSRRPICMWELRSETRCTQGGECLHVTQSHSMKRPFNANIW